MVKGVEPLCVEENQEGGENLEDSERGQAEKNKSAFSNQDEMGRTPYPRPFQ